MANWLKVNSGKRDVLPGAKITPEKNRLLLRDRHRGEVAPGALKLGARLWLQVTSNLSRSSLKTPGPYKRCTAATTSSYANSKEPWTSASSRGEGWLRIEGAEDGVNKARKVFEQLDEARKRGVPVRRHEFNYALQAVMKDGDDDLGRLLELRIQTSLRKPPVVPKTEGQKAYLRSIQTRDITFGIGPAGTGKTYLAMAMAVSALKQEKVSRIVLTRPAVEAGEALGFLPGDLQEKILPYLRPLYDALHDMLEVEEIQKYMDRGVIEIAPLRLYAWPHFESGFCDPR